MLAAVLYGALGLLVGSFLNVVVWRVPRRESVVTPPSACPRCGARIAPRDNVPVLSWLLLRGRCRHCAEPISARYPLVEATTALLFALVGLLVGLDAQAPAFLYLVAIGVALYRIDLDVRRLPDAIVFPAYLVGPVLLALAAWVRDDWSSLARAGLAGAALLTFYVILHVVHPRGMGLGDVKLSGVLGLYLGWVGWGALVVGAFGAFLLGGLVSIGLVLFRGAGRKSTIPYGPFMLVGAGVGLLVGEPVWDAYLSLLA
ncbi:prepilin peptidase [Cellulomonas sp. NS3]|uniref:prepilin peptidase n=1 Tax=Cellulomonas sp. NS3 TaxID=2973977 RepID=UPI002163196C|nr:A24 family peptidase [Cellulomonas sp. NS3]